MRGVTLAETMVATFLLAVAGLFIISTLPLLYASVHQGRQRWYATRLAHSKLTNLRLNDQFLQTTTTGESTVEVPEGRYLGHVYSNSYKLAWTVTPEAENKKRIVVTTSWPQRFGGDQRVVLELVRVRGSL